MCVPDVTKSRMTDMAFFIFKNWSNMGTIPCSALEPFETKARTGALPRYGRHLSFWQKGDARPPPGTRYWPGFEPGTLGRVDRRASHLS